MYVSEPNSIDPALNTAVDGIMIQHTFEGLIKYVDDGMGHARTLLLEWQNLGMYLMTNLHGHSI